MIEKTKSVITIKRMKIKVLIDGFKLSCTGSLVSIPDPKIKIAVGSLYSYYNIEFFSMNQEISLDFEFIIDIDPYSIDRQAEITVIVNQEPIFIYSIDINDNLLNELETKIPSWGFTINIEYRVINSQSNRLKLGNLNEIAIESYKIISKLNPTFYLIETSKGMFYMERDRNKFSIDNKATDNILYYLKNPSHPCLLQLKGYFLTKSKFLCILYEYEELNRFEIHNTPLQLTREDFIYGLIHCFSYFHSLGFYHGRFKEKSITFDKKYHIKFIDTIRLEKIFNEQNTQNDIRLISIIAVSMLKNLKSGSPEAFLWLVFSRQFRYEIKFNCEDIFTYLEAGFLTSTNTPTHNYVDSIKFSKNEFQKSDFDLSQLYFVATVFIDRGKFLKSLDLIKLGELSGEPVLSNLFTVILNLYEGIALDLNSNNNIITYNNIISSHLSYKKTLKKMKLDRSKEIYILHHYFGFLLEDIPENCPLDFYGISFNENEGFIANSEKFANYLTFHLFIAENCIKIYDFDLAYDYINLLPFEEQIFIFESIINKQFATRNKEYYRFIRTGIDRECCAAYVTAGKDEYIHGNLEKGKYYFKLAYEIGGDMIMIVEKDFLSMKILANDSIRIFQKMINENEYIADISPFENVKDLMNDPEYVYTLGYIFHNGLAFDRSKGVTYIIKAAQLGYPQACQYIGFLLKYGNRIKDAIHYYKIGAINGDIICMRNLANLYLDMQSSQGAKKSIKYFKLAAEKGDSYSIALMNHLDSKTLDIYEQMSKK